MRIPLRQLGRVGVIKDLPTYGVPPNGWTDVKNARMFDADAWRCFGYQAVFGVPSIAPLWLLPVAAQSGLLWLYPGSVSIYGTDGTTHSALTRLSGPYTGTVNDRWNGGLLSTGIAIVNNGVDVPQAWVNASLGTRLVDLANWTAGVTARCIRPFKRFLIAMDVTKSGTRYPQLIKWSNQAQAGAVPSTWDHTDPTQDAREWPLLDSDGAVIDGGQMGDVFVLYKEDQTHIMEYIGGTFVFKFSLKFKESGILAQQCYTEYEGKHVVATTTDVVIHDGFQMQSLLDDKMRRWWSGRADATNYGKSFVISNLVENEIWVCIPEAGNTYPNIALVINAKDGTTSVEDLPGVAHMAVGPVDPNAGSITFDTQSQAFDQMVGQFGQRNFSAGRKRLLMAVPTIYRNIVLHSEDFSQPIWSNANLTLGSTVTNPRGGAAVPVQTESNDGAPTQHRFLQTISIPAVAKTWTASFDVRAANANRYILLYVDDGTGTDSIWVRINPNTGVVLSQFSTGVYTLLRVVVESLGSSFYNVRFTFINETSGQFRVGAFWTDTSQNDVYLGTGQSCGYVTNVFVREGRGDVYQKTTSVTANQAFLLQDQELLRDGEGFQTFFERIGLNFWSMDRRGNPIPDMEQKKLLKEIWPQVQVQGITSINVYAGAQDQLEDPVQWTGPFTFTPGVDDKVDVEVEGRLLAVRFECPELNTSGAPQAGFFKLNGYDVVVEPIGIY